MSIQTPNVVVDMEQMLGVLLMGTMCVCVCDVLRITSSPQEWFYSNIQGGRRIQVKFENNYNQYKICFIF